MTKARGSRAEIILATLSAYQLSRKEAAAAAGRRAVANPRRLIHLPSFALAMTSGPGFAGDPEECETAAHESDEADEPEEPDERDQSDEA